MARMITSCFYEVSPVESITFLIAGPADPYVALDDTSLAAKESQSFDITPHMLSGLGGHHNMTIVLLFPGGAAASKGYRIDVSDESGRNLETIFKAEPDSQDNAVVEIMIRVARGTV